MKGVHKVVDVLGLGLHSLVVHKVRSALTVVGILFGVWSVIAMLAINEGLSIESQLALRELGCVTTSPTWCDASSRTGR
jgi:putative ABC transport system permease protein